MSASNREPFVLYEVPITALELRLDDSSAINVTDTLQNGRANYILFQSLVARVSGLRNNSEGGDSDLVDDENRGYEVKSYKDPELWPRRSSDEFHTAASSTFGPNNHGPIIKRLLNDGQYDEALSICCETGFNKNAFYVYTNSSQYLPAVPFRYLIIPTDEVLSMLSTSDPRRISRRDLLARVKRTESVGGIAQL
jgi:hypothetical protein